MDKPIKGFGITIPKPKYPIMPNSLLALVEEISGARWKIAEISDMHVGDVIAGYQITTDQPATTVSITIEDVHKRSVTEISRVEFDIVGEYMAIWLDNELDSYYNIKGLFTFDELRTELVQWI